MEKMDADETQGDVEENDDGQVTESAGGDALEYDESAYVMYHRAQTGVLRLVLTNGASTLDVVPVYFPVHVVILVIVSIYRM